MRLTNILCIDKDNILFITKLIFIIGLVSTMFDVIECKTKCVTYIVYKNHMVLYHYLYLN